LVFIRPLRNRQERDSLSPIDFGFRLRTEALGLILQNDVLKPRAGPAAQDGNLIN
jgi:hypothetical protein